MLRGTLVPNAAALRNADVVAAPGLRSVPGDFFARFLESIFLRLYFFPIAPNATKVRLYLAEERAAGCEIELDEVSVNLAEGEHKKHEHLARNPFGVLLVLELDSGKFLIESLSIIDYLEDLHPEPSLRGIDAESRAMARQTGRSTHHAGRVLLTELLHVWTSKV